MISTARRCTYSIQEKYDGYMRYRMLGCRKFCWPRLCLILGLTKSFRATAANAFSPLLIVLSKFVVQEVISMTLGTFRKIFLFCFFNYRNLREPEKTPAIKSPGRPGIAPATSRTMNGTNWSWRNGLMLIILKEFRLLTCFLTVFAVMMAWWDECIQLQIQCFVFSLTLRHQGPCSKVRPHGTNIVLLARGTTMNDPSKAA